MNAKRNPADSLVSHVVAERMEGKTLGEIGTPMGHSKEWVRQIIMRRFPKGLNVCRKCHKLVPPELGRRKLCLVCKKQASERPCKGCGKLFAPQASGLPRRGSAYCLDCRYKTKLCGFCRKRITRDRGRSWGMFKNKAWFCGRREYNLFVAGKFSKRGHGEKRSAVSIVIHNGHKSKSEGGIS